MKEFIYKYKVWLISIATLLLLIIGLIIYIYLDHKNNSDLDDTIIADSFYLYEENEEDEDSVEYELLENLVTEEEVKYVYIDVKGAVKNPGVYKLADTKIVNDALNAAGGLLSTGVNYNINLSKKLKDEMAIYVFTEEELLDETFKEEVYKDDDIYIDDNITNKDPIIDDSSSDDTNSEDSETSTPVIPSIINLNTATLDQLLSLSGIGESKALDIIAYREVKNFETIEELMEVSGIGESTYEKIKDIITV